MSTLAIDFDDVINGSEGPISGAIEGMYELRKRGYHLVVLTSQTNLDGPDGVNNWLRCNWPDDDPPIATNIKPPAAAYIDDKAFRFTSWREVLANF